MTKNEKKGLLAGVLGLVVGAALATSAVAAMYEKPQEKGGGKFESTHFLGVKSTHTYEGSGNQSKVLVVGQGLLYAICPSGGVIGQYTMAFDTALANSVDVHYRTGLLSPSVYPPLDTLAYESTPRERCWVPVAPVQFSNGLMGVQSATTGNTVFLYRLNGTNP